MNHNNTILFDGDCSMCNYWVKFVTKRATKNRFKFVSLLSKEGKELLGVYKVNEEIDSVILIKNNKAYIKSTAALNIVKSLKFPWFFCYGFIIVPKFLRDYIYDVIAKNRHKFFKKSGTCEIHFKD
jgi:predicted DCC family thiol-disulfide oxidoreductase YuxK